MKICCDLCSGSLRMNNNGQDAYCLQCGMTYTMERLRRMLNPEASVPQAPTVFDNPMPPKANDDLFQINVFPQSGAPAAPQKPAYDMMDSFQINVFQDNAPVAPSVNTAVGMTDPFQMSPFPQPNVTQNPYPAPQFVMQVSASKGDKVTGIVRQGGIGVGDKVYINHDYAHPYQVLGNEDATPVKCGATTLFMMYPLPKHLVGKVNIITSGSNPVESYHNHPGDSASYFNQLLEREFGDYQIQRGVPCNGVKIPVTYLLNKGSQPVVAVFVIDIHNETERYAVKKAAKVLAPYGIGVTHFIGNYRNEAPYVVERIRSTMK